MKGRVCKPEFDEAQALQITLITTTLKPSHTHTFSTVTPRYDILEVNCSYCTYVFLDGCLFVMTAEQLLQIMLLIVSSK